MRFSLPRRHVPLAATALVLVALFLTASLRYEGFGSARVAANLFTDNAFLGITALGMTFVILSGGIDLSVGAVVGFTTIFVAVLVEERGLHPLVVWSLALALGTALGAGMGWLIQAYDMPPFLVTLGGMFFARGMGFYVNDQSVGIDHGLYDAALDLRVPLGGGATLGISSLLFLATFLVALYAAHQTRFGRNVYAVGGDEESARLMGLPVGLTKVGVYTVSGFSSALAGIVATFYTGSGDPGRGLGLELDAIAAVVIGGTLLSGGVGTVAGTLLGILIFGTIKSALVFDGTLSSWWLRIAVGLLLLAFILLQRALARGSRRPG